MRHPGDYQTAYAAAIGRCSTTAAPGYSFPAAGAGIRTGPVSKLLIETKEDLKMTCPNPDPNVRTMQQSLMKAA